MNKIIRNISIFITIALTCGWFGVWVNTKVPSPSPQQSLGMLIWIITPMLTGFLLRWLGRDGWSDAGFGLNLRGNGLWYAVSLLLYPLTILLTIGLGALTGAVSFLRPFSEFLPVFAIGIAASLIKNIGEEFAWRGYLTPRFKALGLGSFANHMSTALIWGMWHIPYWIFFLGSDIISQYSSLGTAGFILLAIFGIFPTALILGELRLKTGSVWPAYIAHNITNAISAQLILDGFIKIKPGAELIFSPNTDAVIMITLFWLIGFWMLKKEAKQP